MLGKLIAWGQDRAEAIARLDRALEEHSLTGIKTNTALASRAFSAIRNFCAAKSTPAGWMNGCRNFCPRKQTQDRDAVAEDAAILAALLHSLGGEGRSARERNRPRKRNRAGSAKRASSRSTGANDARQ